MTAFGRAYQNFLRFVLRFEYVAVLLFFCGLGLTYWVYQHVPKGFIPAEDGGYLIIAVQSPQGASLEYTTTICSQVRNDSRESTGDGQRFFRRWIQLWRKRFQSRSDFCRPERLRPAQGRRTLRQLRSRTASRSACPPFPGRKWSPSLLPPCKASDNSAAFNSSSRIKVALRCSSFRMSLKK